MLAECSNLQDTRYWSRILLTYVYQMLVQKEELQEFPIRRAPPQIVQQVVQQTVIEAFSFRGCMQLLHCEPWVMPHLCE